VEGKTWNFSHNNCPPIEVEAKTEPEAIRKGLDRIGMPTTPHPVRAWLKAEEASGQ
jgi:hypothetical protein